MVWTRILGFLKAPIMKVIVVLALGAAITYGSMYVVNWYGNNIEAAKIQGRDEVIGDQNQEVIKDYELQLTIQKMEKEELQDRLLISYKEIEGLKKQLLVDHDLDKLLQAKPGLTLKAVNDGTTEVFNELREVSNE